MNTENGGHVMTPLDAVLTRLREDPMAHPSNGGAGHLILEAVREELRRERVAKSGPPVIPGKVLR